MQDDITLIADGTQQLVLRRPGSDFETKIERALLRPYRHQRPFGVRESIVPAKYGHWYFSHDSLSERPREGDELDAADGIRWTVVEVNRSDMNATWQCVAKSYDIVFGLDEFVDHLKTGYRKTAAGILEREFRVEKTGIAARFSERTVELADCRKVSLFVLVRERIDFERFDAIRQADGTTFEIEKVNHPLFPNDWTEVLCTLKS